MEFSLVSTVFNEANRLMLTVEDLINQTLQPSEIIITDAGSTDGTLKILEEWKQHSQVPIIIIVEPKCNVARGRNLAIRSAKYDLIASTDFGCRFDKNWLESIITPFENKEIKIVGGSYTVVEKEQNSLSAKSAYVINNGYKPDMSNSDFIPSSRSIAYKKEVFENVGGYCEWLTLAADDYVFGLELKAKKYSFYLVDKPYVFWGRHNSLVSFEKEAFRYGLGDGEAKMNFKIKIRGIIQLVLRYTSLILLSILFISLFSNFLKSITIFIILLIVMLGFRQYFIYVLKPWLKYKSNKYNLIVLFYSFFLFEKVQFNYLKGYLKGYFYSNSIQKSESLLLQKRLN
jgi:glycosyltransferase involved in cell wall biosynthesis